MPFLAGQGGYGTPGIPGDAADDNAGLRQWWLRQQAQAKPQIVVQGQPLPVGVTGPTTNTDVGPPASGYTGYLPAMGQPNWLNAGTQLPAVQGGLQLPLNDGSGGSRTIVPNYIKETGQPFTQEIIRPNRAPAPMAEYGPLAQMSDPRAFVQGESEKIARLPVGVGPPDAAGGAIGVAPKQNWMAGPEGQMALATMMKAYQPRTQEQVATANAEKLKSMEETTKMGIAEMGHSGMRAQGIASIIQEGLKANITPERLQDNVEMANRAAGGGGAGLGTWGNAAMNILGMGMRVGGPNVPPEMANRQPGAGTSPMGPPVPPVDPGVERARGFITGAGGLPADRSVKATELKLDELTREAGSNPLFKESPVLQRRVLDDILSSGVYSPAQLKEMLTNALVRSTREGPGMPGAKEGYRRQVGSYTLENRDKDTAGSFWHGLGAQGARIFGPEGNQIAAPWEAPLPFLQAVHGTGDAFPTWRKGTIGQHNARLEAIPILLQELAARQPQLFQ